jgi:transcription factor Ssl1
MAPHLARSYHHLFPLDPFSEISNEKKDAETNESKFINEYKQKKKENENF